jgi:hypothetical protein
VRRGRRGRVPAAILEDAEALLAWAKAAVAIAGANS